MFGLIFAYVNLFCVYRLNNSRMESVTVILLRCECVNMGVPFFSQIHTLVPDGTKPACLLAFLVLKDWDISPQFALESAMCAVLQTWAFQTCALRHYVVWSQMQQSFVHGSFKIFTILFQKWSNIPLYLI